MEENTFDPNINNQNIPDQQNDSIVDESILDFSTFYNNCPEVNPAEPKIILASENLANAEIQTIDKSKDDIQIKEEPNSDIQKIDELHKIADEVITVKADGPETENRDAEKIIPTSFSQSDLKIKEPVFYLETEKIKPNPYQPRRYFNQDALNELAGSIREFGILQPLVVSRISKPTEWGENVEYQLIAGERRLLAAKSIGIERVPAIVKDNPDERMKLEMAIIENLQRSDLNAIEMARAFSRLADEFGLAQREIAIKVGKSRESVANTIRLLQLPFEAQKALIDNKISEAHARVILTVANPEKQRALLAETLTFGLSVRELQSLTERFFPKPKDQNKISSEPAKDMYLRQAEIHLAQALSLPVSINKKGSKGKVVINFATEDDFKNILNKFGIQEI